MGCGVCAGGSVERVCGGGWGYVEGRVEWGVVCVLGESIARGVWRGGSVWKGQ